MYLFLSNLSFLEVWHVSVTVPKMLVSLVVPGARRISFAGCMAQLYFFLALACTECAPGGHGLRPLRGHLQPPALPGHHEPRPLQPPGCRLLALRLHHLKVFFIARLGYCGPNVMNHFSATVAPAEPGMLRDVAPWAELVDFLALLILLGPPLLTVSSYTSSSAPCCVSLRRRPAQGLLHLRPRTWPWGGHLLLRLALHLTFAVPSTLTSTSWCLMATQHSHRCSTHHLLLAEPGGQGGLHKAVQEGRAQARAPFPPQTGSLTHPRDPAQTDGTPCCTPGDSAGQPKALRGRPLHHPQGKGGDRAPALRVGATPTLAPSASTVGEAHQGGSPWESLPIAAPGQAPRNSGRSAIMAATRTEQMSP